MNGPARLTMLAAALAVMMVSITGCQKLQARDQLNKGVEAYKAQKYEEAISHFQKATQLDPKLPAAKSYLATAISQNVLSGVTTPENLKLANQAIDTYQEVLSEAPNDVNSMKGIAAIYFNIKQLDKAKDWQKKVLDADSKDAEAAYTIGVIDWTQAHENALKVFGPAGVTDDGQGNVKMPKNVCSTLKTQNTALVTEGLQYLNQALASRPNYDDAMAYLNLSYRRKADTDCGDSAAVKADVDNAQKWVQQAISTRKENEEKKNAGPGGIVLDSKGNLK